MATRNLKLLIGIGVMPLLIVLLYMSVFSLSPASLIDIYRGEDGKTIWAKMKYLPLRKEISGANSYKFYDLQWSPDKRNLAFYDFTRQEIPNKEWELKIFNPRNFQTKTIFVGNYKTSNYKWADNDKVRVYVGAGSGVKIYRDINIDTPAPFIAADNMSPEYWTPEKTF